jgi:hypothetical protein
MTYHCGIGPGLGALAREPHVTCDECGNSVSCLRPGGSPYAWVLARKAPPGWLLLRVEEPFSREDYCPMCAGTKSSKSSNSSDRATRAALSKARAQGRIGVKR